MPRKSTVLTENNTRKPVVTGMNILAHDHIIGWLSTSGRDKDESLYAFCIITSKCFVYKIHLKHCNHDTGIYIDSNTEKKISVAFR